MSELLYNKSKAVEELNKVEGFYPLELARVISNGGQEEQRTGRPLPGSTS